MQTYFAISRAVGVIFLKFFDSIRFVFPLAFQRRIPNFSTTKTREATAKRKRKVKNDVLAFLNFGFVQTYFAISRPVLVGV